MITGTIIGTEEDERKNIIIWVCFTNDGVEVPFYNKDGVILFKDQNCWPLYSKFENFIGKTQEQISDWIKINIEYQIGILIKKLRKPDLNTDIISTIGKLVGTEFDSDRVDIAIDPDNIGSNTNTFTLLDTKTVVEETK